MEHRILLTMVEGVADVRLDRPAKMNAIDPAMFWHLAEVGARLKEDRSLRAGVLSGEGRMFCAGIDVEFLATLSQGGRLFPFADLSQRSHGLANWVQHVVWQWRELPVPVIAAVHGGALGGGFQLALGADLRYVAPGATFSILEAKWGLVPDMAGTQLMRHLAREDIVRELTYTARTFSAEEALNYGFASRVVEDPREAAMATAREIAAKSPDAIRAAKRLLNTAVVCAPGEGLMAEAEAQWRLLGGANQIEAVRANLAQRAPQFLDPVA
ncbi:MAG: crotonase/enoyl-CoA hydratase family protein [Hyphomicrobiaceae bacterium]